MQRKRPRPREIHHPHTLYWTLVVFDDGRRVVRFASQPSYFSQSPGETRHLAQKWSGPPVALARTFQLPVASIKPYLVHNATGKAFPGDEFPRENFWVFTDLWQRLGIEYPLDINGYTHVLRVGKDFLDKLPTEGEL
jgi:hypothetical protein